MLDKYGLYNVTSVPHLNQLSLLLLAEYYEEYLMPYTYIYHLHNGTRIDLEFHPDRLHECSASKHHMSMYFDHIMVT